MKLLLATTLLFTFLAKAQNLNNKKLMGEWHTINIDIPNSDKVPQKEALKMVEDAFLNSKFNFKGNKVFRIKFGKLADDKMKELFFLDNQNWIIKNNQILIGTENDGFSSMHILFQENNGKTYFILPMIRLEVQKLSDDKPSKPETIESKSEKIKNIDYSKVETITKKIDESNIIEFKDVETPPLSPDCKSKWNTEKQKEITKKYILKHQMRKFNTDLGAELNLIGINKIKTQFIIDENGDVVNIVSKASHIELEKEAIRVISLLPKFIPGKQNGKETNVLMEANITFRVE